MVDFTSYVLEGDPEDHFAHFFGLLEELPDEPTSSNRSDPQRERPDRIIDLNGRIIGIDHGRLVNVAESPDSDLIGTDARQLATCRLADLEHKSRGLGPHWIRIEFREGASIPRPEQLAIQLVDLVEGVSSNEDDTAFEFSEDQDPISSLVRSVELRRVESPVLEWLDIQYTTARNAQPDRIRSRIAEKSEDLSEYNSPCEEYWLLLVIDEMTPGSYTRVPQSIADETFEAEYDRIFLLQHAPADQCLYELATK